MALLRLFDGKVDIVDLVLRHYHAGASGWDTAGVEAPILIMQYGPAGDVIARLGPRMGASISSAHKQERNSCV
jgi:hypothetical protein